VPKAKRIAVLVNPTDVLTTDGTLREIEAAARVLGLVLDVHNASTSPEIEDAFTAIVRKNRKREICTSGSVRDEAGQPPHLLGGSEVRRRGRWWRAHDRGPTGHL
jgi:hypothetical protein